MAGSKCAKYSNEISLSKQKISTGDDVLMFESLTFSAS